MPIAQRITDIATWKPTAVGEVAPKLSLTADEGTWIRLPDFKGHIHVVLLFFKSLHDDETDAWLKEFNRQRQRFEEMETAIFGISTRRTDQLREFRASLGLDFYLLYDPLALDSRGFRAASRWRPTIKNTVVLVGKDGTVAWSGRGRPDAATLLAEVARLEGIDVPVDGADESAGGDFTGIRNPGQAADAVRLVGPEDAVKLLDSDDGFVLVDVRTKSEFDADHSPRAVHIPVDELPHRYQELGQTTNIICLCQAGGRSAAAAEFLTSIGGSSIYNVEGGMSSWSGDRVTGGVAQD